jgi:putative lipoic acid-binding regulatory protein
MTDERSNGAAPAERRELLQFPCDFPIKVMGRANDEFRAQAREIVERHAGSMTEERVTERLSKDGNFLSVTYTIRAASRPQLDELYRELSAHEMVLVVL